MEGQWEVEKERGEESMRGWEGQRGKARKEIKGLVRNLALGKFPGIHKNDPN